MNEFLSRAGVVLIGLAGLLFGFLLPDRAETVFAAPPIPVDAPYVACSVALAGSGFESTVGIVADSPTSGAITGVGVGGPAEPFALGSDESAQFEVASLAELGVTPILVERLTGGEVGAAVLGRAGAEASLAGCQPATSSPVALLGMATSEGEQSAIVLANPFAVEATARLAGSSEFGADTVAEIETVRVPADATLTLPIGQLMSGRQQLGFTVYTEAGAVVAGMTRSGPDIATSEAISGAQEWFVPLPAFGLEGNLIIRNLAAVDATYRVDAINPEGVVEGIDNGAIPPDSEFWFSLTDLGASGGLMVTSDETVAVATVFAGEATRVVSTASPTATVAWLIPLGGDDAQATTAVWIFNPNEEGATVEVSVFGGATTEITAPGGTTTGQMIRFGSRGGIVTASGDVAVFYGVVSESGAASMTLAIPLE